MVQELQVLRCFSCETFQGHIVKKLNKWECKVCGAKQSVKKVYGRGSGKDCRIHTQKLNNLRGLKEETESSNVEAIEQFEPQPVRRQGTTNDGPSPSSTKYCNITTSKWAEFMDENVTSNSQNDFSKENLSDYNAVVKSRNTKVHKRKIEEHLNDEVIANYTIENSVVLSSDTNSASFTKKLKSNNYMSRNNSHNTFSINDGESYTQKACTNEATNQQNKSGINKQNDRKQWGKWAEYLGNEEETWLNNSQNTTKMTHGNNTSKLSLKSTNYFKEEKDRCSTRKFTINTGLQQKLENDLSNSFNSNFPVLEEDRDSHHYSRVVSCNSQELTYNLWEGKASADAEKVVSSQGNFVSHINTEKICEPNFNLRLDEHCSVSSRKNISQNSEGSSIVLESKDVEETNTRKDLVINSKLNKQFYNNIRVDKVKEPMENSIADILPVFEQNTDLTDIDFQLDF